MILECLGCHHRYDVTKYKAGQRLRCACGQILKVPLKADTHAPRVVNTFHCATCGGNLEKGKKKCSYCGALVDLTATRLTAYCPGCLTMSPEGARFCSGCGQPLTTRLDTPTQANEQCPRCNIPMREREIEAHKTLECPICLGIFVAVDAFEELIRKQETRVGEAPQTTEENTGRKDLSVTYIKCPVCHGIMNRMNYGRISGVIVDFCRNHGYWLDNGELQKIAEWVVRGGLQKKYTLEVDEAKSAIRKTKLEQPMFDYEQTPKSDSSLFLNVLAGLFGR